jgi:hypothetical protein
MCALSTNSRVLSPAASAPSGLNFRQGSAQTGALRQDTCTFDEIFQLTHVSRPRPFHQCLKRIRRIGIDQLAHLPGVLLHEVAGSGCPPGDRVTEK